jgi:pilus assembly protein Flp/PilA
VPHLGHRGVMDNGGPAGAHNDPLTHNLKSLFIDLLAFSPAKPSHSMRGVAAMSNILKNFAKDESGATAIEYGLIAALVAIGLIAALTALGKSLSQIFRHVSTALNTASS